MDLSTFKFLAVLDRCDNFAPRNSDEALSPFFLSDFGSSETQWAIGLIRPIVLDMLREDNERSKKLGLEETWIIRDRASAAAVSFHSSLTSPTTRSAAINALCARWHNEGIFANVIGGRMWRNELYPVFKNPFGRREFSEDPSSNYAFSIERAAAALFGLVTYGVHMTVYQSPSVPLSGAETKEEETYIWVPRRAKTKQTWPLHLDNTVAGGLPTGMSILDCIVKESMEEASIPEEYVRKYARPCGAVSYFFRNDNGWLQPEIEYVYDLLIPTTSESGQIKALFEPKPLDGEVESFELLPLYAVLERMRNREFKPNCALVLLDFLIRHGYITPDTEPNYMEILTRLKGRFEWDKWASL